LNSLKSLGYSECVSIDLTIVRGLAYYTGFVFEVFEVGAEGRALAGGGRYDTLVKKLGGPRFTRSRIWYGRCDGS
jgi:histidyl-tRNA synthetase